MISTNASIRKICAKCLEHVNVYTTCFDCDAIYHIYCLKKVPGVQTNPQGALFCCRNITSKHGRSRKILTSQDDPLEKVTEKDSLDNCRGDLENSLPDDEDSERNKFKCDSCFLEFTNKEHLEGHYRECPYIIQGGLIQDISWDKDLENCLPDEEDSERNKFKCDSCLLEFTNKERLDRHYRECPYIIQGGLIQDINRDKDLENCLHKEKDLECNKFKCDGCSLELKNEEHLEKHYREYPHKRGIQLEQELCKDKDFSLYKGTTFHNHILAKHSNAKKRYQCTDCKYSAHRKADLVHHIRTHTNERPFKCDTCDYAAGRRRELNNHILAKHSNAKKKYKCNDCKYSAHRKADLVYHIRTHTNERPFKCDTCDYAASQRRELNNHILAKHSNAKKKYKCNDCKYSAHHKADLVYHKRTHANERPFKCDTCGYAAIQRTELNNHILAKHSNVKKKYKCNDCKYSAHRKTDLVRHTRTHTNERPFKCDTCDYAANHRRELNNHILAKHSNAEKCISAVIANIPLTKNQH